MSYEDKFYRRYACCTHNHGGWVKYKTSNRRTARRKIKIDTIKEMRQYRN